MGYGLYVNMLVYAYLRLYSEHESADQLRGSMSHLRSVAKRRTVMSKRLL